MACEWGIFKWADNPRIMATMPDWAAARPEDMEQKVRCIVCGIYPVFPMGSMSMCGRGHLYCLPCAIPRRDQCGATLVRRAGNRPCEKVIETLPGRARPRLTEMFNISTFLCGYGCGATKTGFELGDHLLERCPYRFESPCLVTGCSVIRYKGLDFWNHLVERHSQALVQFNNRQFEMWFTKKGSLVAGHDATKRMANYRIPPTLRNSACSVHLIMTAFQEKFVIFCEEFPDRFEFFGLVLNRREVAEQFQFFVKFLGKNRPIPLAANICQCETELLGERRGYLKDKMAIKIDKGLIFEDISSFDGISCRGIVSVWVERKR